MPDSPKVTAADIARLAGVGRAAVSNWRKRHADFPGPVSGTAASPEFDLAVVEEWLRRQGKLPELSDEDRLWSRLAAADDNIAATLGAVGGLLLAHHRGEAMQSPSIAPQVLGAVVKLADDRGAGAVFDGLWQRFVQVQAWRVGVTPEPLTDLMIGLSNASGGTVLDPACGTGNILRAAVRAGCTAAYGQEIEPHTARLIELWLALRGVPGGIRIGDSLRADAFAGLTVDAVVSNLPFGDTNWGHDELGYDPRWEYGMPPRTEPELAWVQHALAHLRAGGTAVLLMPPSAASRRAGRRIRSELLRRGSLQAVIALPAKAAAPHSVSLHLWVLRRPDGQPAPSAQVLMVDAVDGDTEGGYARILNVFQAFVRSPGGPADEAGFARAVPVIELLDEDVDLTPTRRQPSPATEVSADTFVRVREQVAPMLEQLPALLPGLSATTAPATAPTVSVADLVKSGALQVLGPVRQAAKPHDADVDRLVLTVNDVLHNRAASSRAGDPSTPEICLAAGDVVVPTVARPLTARVVTEDGPLLGPNLYVLRPNPAALDPWFLAGQIRTAANERHAASTSGAFRFDVRRAQVLRLPPADQRRIGEAFRALGVFDEALHRSASLGAELIRAATEGLARGMLLPRSAGAEGPAESPR
ncbi:N-6 DNA methylase [Dactylosporangium sp. CA-139066]|uniref:N-6 DNA methylase n=1 Tax=Dactylosporangium sp. CA-139066 TaxID=3239930 RepID=UPI003D8BE3EF